MSKLKEYTTIVLGTLGTKLDDYQQRKLAEIKRRKALLKILSKYWQLANNTENVWLAMDYISGNIKYQILKLDTDNDGTVSQEDFNMYNRAYGSKDSIFEQDLKWMADKKEYETKYAEFQKLIEQYIAAGYTEETLPETIKIEKQHYEEFEQELNDTRNNLDVEKVQITNRCREKLVELMETIKEIDDKIKLVQETGDTTIKLTPKKKELKVYYDKYLKHKSQLVDLNVLGVDIKLTTEIIKADIEIITEYIEKLQEVIDSFAFGNDDPLLGKFNKRLKQFTKRLLKIVNYINTEWPNVDVDLSGTNDENPMNADIFTDDILEPTQDQVNDVRNRHFYDLNKDDEVDNADLAILKKIVKLMSRHKLGDLTTEELQSLIDALDTNADGSLNKVDVEWLESYIQDQEEIGYIQENGWESGNQYHDANAEGKIEPVQGLVDKIADPNYKGAKGKYTPTASRINDPENSNTTDLYNLSYTGPIYFYTTEQAKLHNELLEGAVHAGDPVVYTEEMVIAYNSQLETTGAVHTGDNVKHTQETAAAYNLEMGIDGVVTTDDYKIEEQHAIYAFTSYANADGTNEYGEGIAEVISIDEENNNALIKVLTNEALDPNAADFAGTQFIVHSLDETAILQLFSENDEELPIYVSVSKKSDAIAGVKYTEEEVIEHNATLETEGAAHAGDDMLYTPAMAAEYNVGLEGAITTEDWKTPKSNAIYSFISYSSSNTIDENKYGEGTVEVVDINETTGMAIVKVLTNEALDPNAADFVGTQFIVYSLDENSALQLFSPYNEPQPIYVKITKVSDASEGEKYSEEDVIEYNSQLDAEGAVHTGDPVVYTQTEAAEHNATLEGAVKVGDPMGLTYTEEDATIHNATLPGAVKVGDPII